MSYTEFKKDLIKLINTHSINDKCKTPDYILAEFILQGLMAYEQATEANIKWHNWKRLGD